MKNTNNGTVAYGTPTKAETTYPYIDFIPSHYFLPESAGHKGYAVRLGKERNGSKAIKQKNMLRGCIAAVLVEEKRKCARLPKNNEMLDKILLIHSLTIKNKDFRDKHFGVL